MTIDTTISDIRGRNLKALTVFSHAIRYLKDHLLKSLKDKGSIVKERDILWVLTVPAIWDHTAKLFMRKAAEKVFFTQQHPATHIFNLILISLEQVVDNCCKNGKWKILTGPDSIQNAAKSD